MVDPLTVESLLSESLAASATREIRLELCQTPAQRQLFERAAEVLYAEEVDFVPPWPGTVARHLHPLGNFQRSHGPLRGWLAWHEGRIVGRLAAIVHGGHQLFQGDRVGFFGFPALTTDEALAGPAFTRLLQAAEEWLRREGCDTLRGPYNPSINEECGLWREGEPGPPMVGMTWNPAGTEAVFLAAGLRLVRESVAFKLDLSLGEPERIRRVRERVARRHALTLRHLNLRQLPEELVRLQALYNRTLDRNWGFIPMRYEDWLESAAAFRQVIDPRLILLAESRGRPAAFAMTLPNVHEILWAARRVPAAWRWPFLLGKVLTHRYRSCRLAVLGVAPEFRDRGLTGWLFGEMQRRAARNYTWAEISWVETNNTEILANAELMGCRLYRRYGIYEKPLGAPPSRL